MAYVAGSPPGNFVSRITVRGLYGEFDYDIGPPKDGADPRIIILYGDNGTGKTTILQLLRSLMSPNDESGHRSRIAKIPFKRFEVDLRDGTRICAEREGGESVGSYILSISGGGEGGGVKVNVQADANCVVKTSSWSQADQVKFSHFLQRLAAISKDVSFLDDKRTFGPGDDGHRRSFGFNEGKWLITETATEDPVAEKVSALAESVRREALMRQRRGSGDSQTIYRNLIATIAKGNSPRAISLEAVISKLIEAEVLSREFSKIGLMAPLCHEPIISQLRNVSEARKDVVTELVLAYVDSTEAWFSALKELNAQLEKFIGRLNFFMATKTAEFTVGDGLKFLSKQGLPLGVSALSSGERHLVMMLVQALLLRNDTGLVIIDEPELSLNMKWQRELVAAILDCLGGGGGSDIYSYSFYRDSSQVQGEYCSALGARGRAK
ncbi:AAA family ATPase [Lysobacter firmicutimachus]|uniref:AAA family ATPase n=1 Tax=Lysobacter firmicutimachus TaxID=1792846 RepID=A0ABU8D282_9GAMM